VNFVFGIIGGGLTATAMLCQFVKQVQGNAEKGHLNPSSISVSVFEKQDVFGPGFPHNARFALPFHVTNMCAFDMGVLAGGADDFQNWVTSHYHELGNRFSWFPGPSSAPHLVPEGCNHYPRAVMGEYLRTRFGEAVRNAKALGLQVKLYPASEVVDLVQLENGVRLTIRDLSSGRSFQKEADRVLLATGHWPRGGRERRYFLSPWPAEKLHREIPEDEKVAVIGTSLSAIETVLTLTSEGTFNRSRDGILCYLPSEHSRKIFLYSRKGLLPRVRGKTGNRRNRFLNQENLDRLLAEKSGKLELDDIFHLLTSDLEDAYGHAIDWEAVVSPKDRPKDLLRRYLHDARYGDGPEGEIVWQTVLHQCFDLVKDIYVNLKLEEKRRFDKAYASVFFTHAAPQPYMNAEKLLALMEAGIVDVRRLGTDYRIVKEEDTDCYAFIYTDTHGKQRKDTYRYLVDARGQSRNLETDPSELTKALLRSGTVQIEEIRPMDGKESAGEGGSSGVQTGRPFHKTGTALIDPETNLIMQKGPGNRWSRSSSIYAVGAMTRGQIIDASMARSIVRSTCRIADDLVEHLVQVQNPLRE